MMTEPYLIRAVIGILMMMLPVIYIMCRPELDISDKDEDDSE